MISYEHDRKMIQDLYIRVCKDSGFSMNYLDAAIFVGEIFNISPLEVWISFSCLEQMEEIATKKHLLVKDI